MISGRKKRDRKKVFKTFSNYVPAAEAFSRASSPGSQESIAANHFSKFVEEHTFQAYFDFVPFTVQLKRIPFTSFCSIHYGFYSVKNKGLLI